MDKMSFVISILMMAMNLMLKIVQRLKDTGNIMFKKINENIKQKQVRNIYSLMSTGCYQTVATRKMLRAIDLSPPKCIVNLKCTSYGKFFSIFLEKGFKIHLRF